MNSATPELFPVPIPPAPPVATPGERAELLVQLRELRRRLLDSYAVGLALGEPLVPSIVGPLAIVQQAIAACETELRLEP